MVSRILPNTLAGTNPPDADSRLRITRIQADQGPGVTLAWPSVANRIYTLERASREPAGFIPLTVLFGNSLETSFRDVWPTNPPPRSSVSGWSYPDRGGFIGTMNVSAGWPLHGKARPTLESD